MTVATIASMWDPLQRFLERGALLVPVLLAMFVVLLFGLMLAYVLEGVVRAVLRAVGFDRLGRRAGVADAMRRASLRREPSLLAGQVVRWVVVILTLLGALSILSAEATDSVISAMAEYLPRLAGGLLLIVLGYALSAFASRSVLIWAVNSRLHGGRWLATGVRLLIGVFFVALALENLGFGRDVALVVLAILLGGGVLAAALAFGLAGKDLARQSLERMTLEMHEEDRDTLSHL